MPVEPHPSLQEPDPDALLWRYMDLAKFAALITSGQLWFSNPTELAREDPQEGTLPSLNFAHRSWFTAADVPPAELEKIRGKISYGPAPFDDDIEYRIAREAENRDMRIRLSFIYRRSCFVSCWHLASDDSPAMWKIYGAPGPGVAITTTAAQLKQALADNPESIFLGGVRYIDPKRETVDTENIFNALFTKWNNYSYEREVRLIYRNTALEKNMPSPIWNPERARIEMPEELLYAFERKCVPLGHPFLCRLQKLIDGVWVSPYSRPWYYETVSRLCDLVGISRTHLKRSTLLNPPLR